MPEKKEIILVHRYLTGQMETTEKEEFEQRLAVERELTALYEELASVWKASGHIRLPEFDSGRGYRQFQQRVRTRYTVRRTLVRAAAAIILLLIAGSVYLQNKTRALTSLVATATIEKRLEDGSLMHLREGAHMLVPEVFDSKTRLVEIVSGDIFFDISPDENRPFVISHPWADVKVVGTEFIISIDTVARSYTIMVIEGKVSFSPQLSQEEFALTAGKGLRFDADTRVIERIRKIEGNAISWHTGVLTFVDMPVKDVIADLRDYFGVQIEISNPEIADCLFTAPLPYRNASLEVILDALSTTFGMTTQPDGKGHYVLTNGKCR